MSATNNVNMVGYVAQEPKIYEKDGRPSVANFSIGVTERLWNKDEGKMTNQKSWFNCVAFGPAASAVNAVVKVGRTIACSGRLAREEHEDKTYYRVEVNDILVVDWGDEGSSGSSSEQTAPSMEEDEFPF